MNQTEFDEQFSTTIIGVFYKQSVELGYTDKEFTENIVNKFSNQDGTFSQDFLDKMNLCEEYILGLYNPHMSNNYKNMKQISEFKLIGLSRSESFTCEFSHNHDIFWAKNGLGIKKFNELWENCRDNWDVPKIVEIEHEGYYEDGLPKNPFVIGMREVTS